MNPLKPALIDEWSTREKLALASSVLTAADQNWYSASRSIKPFAELNRPHDWFSQKNCAIQYNELIDKVEKPKRKRGEKNEDTAQNLIVRKLTSERIEELKKEIEEDRQELNELKKIINLLKNDNLSETDQKIIEKQMLDALQQIKRDEEEHEKWLKIRAEKYASLNRNKSIVSAKMPRKDDQSLSTPIKTTPSSTIVTPVSNQQITVEQPPIDLNKNTTPSIEEQQEQLTLKQEKLSAQEQSEQPQQIIAEATNKVTTKEKSKMLIKYK